MNKKTVVMTILCFVCVGMIGMFGYAGAAKLNAYQAAQTVSDSQQAQKDYVSQTASSFDALYALENDLFAWMDSQQQLGRSDREILMDAIEQVRTPLNELARLDAPDETTAQAQKEFATAADSYSALADTLTALLADENVTSQQLSDAARAQFSDAVTAFDHIKYGVQVLTDNGLSVPDSAVQLISVTQSLIDEGIENLLGAA